MTPKAFNISLLYTYENFDSTGNWHKKTSLIIVTKFGKSYWEPSEVSYRAIIYYYWSLLHKRINARLHQKPKSGSDSSF